MCCSDDDPLWDDYAADYAYEMDHGYDWNPIFGVFYKPGKKGGKIKGRVMVYNDDVDDEDDE